MTTSPFHEGELRMQQRAGESRAAARNGVMIRNAIPERALSFLRQQMMAVIGNRDRREKLWASVIFGRPGFLDPGNDGRSLRIGLSESARFDPLSENIEIGAKIGVLVLEMSTRRRLRINGPVTSFDSVTVQIETEESYPNCPKYIQRRHLRYESDDRSARFEHRREGSVLDPHGAALIGRADTFFVATAHPDRGMDASHRGGKPGFVKVLDSSTLRIPDYPGNSMFNTLGNLAVDPHAGLAFPDFETGVLLQLSGTAEILWDQADPAGETGGTGRFWRFYVEAWAESELPKSLIAEFVDYSPYNPWPVPIARRQLLKGVC